MLKMLKYVVVIMMGLLLAMPSSYASYAHATAASPANNRHELAGRVTDIASGEPLCGVVIKLGEDYLWAVTNIDGEFTIENVDGGAYVVKLSYLGYVDAEYGIDVKQDMLELEFQMQESSLALDEVTVTAQRPKDGLSTSHTLGRDALNHLQMSNMADMAALLPGGKTVNPDLTTSNSISLRDGGSTAGNAAFGTAVEVDGVRMGNNAGFGGMTGVDTRSISVDNIESVEVVTGVPSAEYGDLNSGMVKINTKKGRTPYNVTFSVNPRTYQVSASKGFDLQKDRGVINASAEWARATKKLTSPYESYTRRGVTLNYSNTFAKVLRFEAGGSFNIGGMNSEDDPDATAGNWQKVRDNVYKANTALTWMINKPGITNLKLDASIVYQDNLSHTREFNSAASNLPAIHSTTEGYALADRLDKMYYSNYIVDSKELDASAGLKYEWTKRWGEVKSQFKAGAQWKATGNIGQGEYYTMPSAAANGFRDENYSEYPFMHNLSFYAEEHLTVPLWSTKFELTAGLREENVFIKGSNYQHMNTFSPRFNAKWTINDHLSIRGGWGITEKLPSFYILYPRQQYWDKQVFSFSHGTSSSYVYYSRPIAIEYNPDLRWQRNQNSEFGIDAAFGEFKISAVAFYNKTQDPYKLTSLYSPFSYCMLTLPSGYTVPDNPQIVVDNQNGDVYVRGDDNEFWQLIGDDDKTPDKTFVKTSTQTNGADIKRAGAELTIDFPTIKPIRTSFRLDANYSWTRFQDESLSYYYQNSYQNGRSFKYVGIYANGNSNTPVVTGKITHNLDANITAITHIPEARLIITARLEMSLLTRSRNISSYNGSDYAFTVESDSYAATGGNIYNDRSYTAILPVAFEDVDGNSYKVNADGQISKVGDDTFSASIFDAEYSKLILKSSNIYTFAKDGYGFYCSANLSITKEIGKHVSLSFFANNFTNSRPYVTSMATGVGAIFTPSFYYGLTCRVKF